MTNDDGTISLSCIVNNLWVSIEDPNVLQATKKSIGITEKFEFK